MHADRCTLQPPTLDADGSTDLFDETHLFDHTFGGMNGIVDTNDVSVGYVDGTPNTLSSLGVVGMATNQENAMQHSLRPTTSSLATGNLMTNFTLEDSRVGPTEFAFRMKL